MLNRKNDTTEGWPREVVRDLIRELESQGNPPNRDERELLRALQQTGVAPEDAEMLLVRHKAELLTINRDALEKWAEEKLRGLRGDG